MENKSHALAAGLFVIVVTALLAGLGLWLTRDTAHYTRYELSSQESISGLQPQAAVYYKGVMVGKVTHIGFDAQATGNILIRLNVNADAPLGDTTYATLGYQGVTGLAHIQLDDSPMPLQRPPAGDSGLPRLPLHSSPFNRLTTQGPALLATVQETAERINRLLGDDNQKNFGSALAQLGQTARSVENLAQRLETSVGTHLEPALATLPQLAQDAHQTLQALRQAGQEASAVAQEVQTTVQSLNAEGGALHAIAESARSLSAVTEQFGHTTLPRLHQAADATSQAARRVGRMAEGISNTPQSLIYGSPRASAGPGEPGFVAPHTENAP